MCQKMHDVQFSTNPAVINKEVDSIDFKDPENYVMVEHELEGLHCTGTGTTPECIEVKD